MGNRYLHIGFNWFGARRTDAVQKVIEANATDWMKYGGNCWIVYTSEDQTTWSERLKQHLSGNDNLIICEVTNLPASNGYLPTGMWDWFNRFRY